MEVHVDSKMLAMHRLILHEIGNGLYWVLQSAIVRWLTFRTALCYFDSSASDKFPGGPINVKPEELTRLKNLAWLILLITNSSSPRNFARARVHDLFRLLEPRNPAISYKSSHTYHNVIPDSHFLLELPGLGCALSHSLGVHGLGVVAVLHHGWVSVD